MYLVTRTRSWHTCADTSLCRCVVYLKQNIAARR